MFEVPEGSLDEWLDCLKPYQREQITNLVRQDKPLEEVAGLWITASGPANTIGFGGAGDTKPFIDNFKAEFNKFICGSPEYEEDRKKIETIASKAKTLIVSTISAVIAVKLGVMASLLVPAVALLLHIVGKMGVRAWCQA